MSFTSSCCFVSVTNIVGVTATPTILIVSSEQFTDKLSDFARGLIGTVPEHMGIPPLVHREIY